MLCSAPFNSILVDVDKTVKPCCIWIGKNYGNLNSQDINTILNSDYVKNIQNDMVNNVWNEGCLNCKKREEETGISPRINVYNNTEFKNINVINQHKKITLLEYNSTNTCNLSCAMCSPKFSSNLHEFNKHFNWENTVNNLKFEIYGINQSIAKNFVESLDLSELTTLWLKGGEPFLNKEIITVLEHLKKINRLGKITIWINSNGTVINQTILELLSQCEKVKLNLSIDGTDRINRYIRYGFGNPNVSGLNVILKNIENFLKLDNLTLSAVPTIQAINIFDLYNFYVFWNNNVKTIKPNNVSDPFYGHFCLRPDFLQLRVLKDETRNFLIRYYSSISIPGKEDMFNKVLEILRKPYLGDEYYQKFVNYVKMLDSTREEKLLDIEPKFGIFNKF